MLQTNPKSKTRILSKESGAITLGIVSSILILVGLFSFAVMKTSSNQIKKIQNMVIAEQERANAKAALDCAIALFIQLDMHPSEVDLTEFEQCKTDKRTIFSIFEKDKHWQLSAKTNYFKANRVISYLSPTLASLTTTGNVEINHGSTWQAASKSLDGDQVECLSIIAGGEVKIDLTASLQHFSITPLKNTQKCIAKTFISAGKKFNSIEVDSNIVQHKTELNLFEMLFSVKKDAWQNIRDKFDTVIYTGSAVDSEDVVSQCGLRIKEAINAGAELIWIEGDCLLDGLSDTGSQGKAPLVVVKNGIVAASQVLEQVQLSFFQFTHAYSNEKLRLSWLSDPLNPCSQGAMKNLCLKFIDTHSANSVFWQNLAFYFANKAEIKGSYLLDIPNSTVFIDTEVSFEFNPMLVEHEIIKGQLQVLKGSFHDF